MIKNQNQLNDKIQNPKSKINPNTKYQIPKRLFCHLSFMLCAYFVICALSFVISSVYAEEITILYTGETHAMLYPCNCPKEADGGVARRATLIKQLRKANPNTLLLDSGGLFAGGLSDEYTQNTQLDSQRTIVNLKAIELMEYDALAVGDDELNFGREFLEENIKKTQFCFLSSNIQSELFKPYLIKEIAGTRVGIIGLTTLSAMQKAGGLKFLEPMAALKQAVEELKKNKVDIIVLLSHLGENEDLRLIKEIEGIDIIIVGHGRAKEEPSTKAGSTLILRPSWQGRRLGKLSLKINPVRNTKTPEEKGKISNGVKDKKIIDYKVEELRLSEEISDDSSILSVLPRCFSDANCKKQGLLGICQDPGSINSRCLFSEATKINLLIISPKLCRVCNTEGMVNYLKTQFPGLIVSYLYYPDTKANKLVKDFQIQFLPVYLLGKEIKKEKSFDNLKENLEIKGDFYMLKPERSGISYFLDRRKIKGKLDLFISLYDKDICELLDMLKEFAPVVHFLAVEQTNDRFDAAKGNLEVEDYLRAVCIEKYYPQNFWDYISCRGKFNNSSWWEDCAAKLDIEKVKTCARSQEGRSLLKENINLNIELKVMFGPAYLIDNQEVFGSDGVPTKEEFKKIIGR